MLQLLSVAELAAHHPDKALAPIDRAISLYPGPPPAVMERQRAAAASRARPGKYGNGAEALRALIHKTARARSF
jgi:hypothetical protein